MVNSLRPVQIIHSFEGLINGTDGVEVMISYGRPKELPDICNFEERVRAELVNLKERGIGGLAVNVGYENYLEDEPGWQRFLLGVNIAVEMGFRLWIYDENGYPSGTAGGGVLKNHPGLEAFGIKKMVIENPSPSFVLSSPEPRAEFYAVFGLTKEGLRRIIPVKDGARDVSLKAGKFKTIEAYFKAPLYEGSHAARNPGSSRRYINLLEPAAVSRFLKLTHLRYFDRIPGRVRKNIEAIFTDEPSLMTHVMNIPQTILEEDPVDNNLPLFPSVPWCNGLESQFLTEHGIVLKGRVWMLFSGKGKVERKVRRAFWDTISRIYRKSYAEQTASVCSALGIDFSGHLLWEETIYQHAVLHGNMLAILKNFHRPGVDVLTCNPELFMKLYALTHKIAISASFFGSRRGVMTESSDYAEYWHANKKGAPIEDIKGVLALQYLLGVRDFCFYLVWRRFTGEEYRSICDFVTLLVETGKGKSYLPGFALYYPIELVWECRLPSNQPMMKEGFDSQPKELKRIEKAVTDACRNLFMANRQFIMCGREEIGHLKGIGIENIVYPDIGNPAPELVSLCRKAGVNLIKISDIKKSGVIRNYLTVGKGVVYACYEGFFFAVNYSREKSFVSVPEGARVMFPVRSEERKNVCGNIEIKQQESMFIFQKV
ncbi:MAG: hypothetical protein HY350_01245 [Candidatus Omnitrophica bacterium]|nr:hypothetical protein [Candidatus Omnitrophota bacterium]